MSLGVVTGLADRACAFVLAGYCGVTALLWKQFWKPGDFWASNTGQGRTLFWDFLKNFAVAAGFLLITFGTDARSVDRSSRAPFGVVSAVPHERRATGATINIDIIGSFQTSSFRMTMVKCLSRIEMVCDNARALASFYEEAFGFLGLDEADRFANGIRHGIRMRLGQQEIALIDVRPQAAPTRPMSRDGTRYFSISRSSSQTWPAPIERLSAIPGWSPISTAGPQLLPPASGGVSAFKFRDPEGHPLELIAFAPDAIPTQWQLGSDSCCLGIDHSALSVANTAKSIAFYESLGLSRSGGSLNIGPEQVNLDDVPNAVVEVTTLTPAQSTPHVELLCYRGDFDRHVQQRTNDVTATRLVFSVESREAFDVLCTCHADSLVTDSVMREDNARRVLLRDPDGHLVCLETGA